MKFDLHCHSVFSGDAFCPPEKLVKAAVQKKLDGFAITDHNTTKGFEIIAQLAKKSHLQVVRGEEIDVKRNGKSIGEVLGLFLKKEITPKEPEKVMKEIKDQGGLVVIPHPFHPFSKFKDDLEKYLSFIDGIEVFNARHPFSKPDRLALEFAKKHNLAEVGGSDCHFFKELGAGYTLVEDAQNLEDFKKGILEKKSVALGKKSPFCYLIFPTLAKLKNRCFPSKD